MKILEGIKRSDKLGTAVRYENPKGSKWFSKHFGRKIYIEPQALTYVQALNGYDQLQVCKGIEGLASIPSPIDGLINTLRPAHFKAKQASTNAFNFIIKYTLTSKEAVISSVYLNTEILGQKVKSAHEKPCLYHVEKIGPGIFNEKSSLAQVKALEGSWSTNAEDARTKVTTTHAAVNGMLNNLEKAAWLMGVHSTHAYSSDQFNEYTLFHNPSESPILDFYESARDNLGITTANAKHLAAILQDIQRKGKPVKWTAHSQGGIIFKQAIKHHLKYFPNQMLDKNTVVIHAGGNHKSETDQLLQRVGIKKAAPDRDNPFDLVPNIAGGNDLRPKTLKRSILFGRKVKGNKTSSAAESPHTLPFLGLECYHAFLTLAGDERSAKRVKKYMDEICNDGSS